MQLRPYQREAVKKIFEEWNNGHTKTLYVAGTGTGKTIVIAEVVRVLLSKGEKVLIIAHRGELLDQAADKIKTYANIDCAIEKAEQTSIDSGKNVVIASTQTLQNNKRLSAFSHDYFSTVIIDEAHHAVSKSYVKIIDWFPNAKILGVTATPDRGDKKALAEVFDSIAYEYSMRQAIKDGYLVKLKAITIPLKINILGAKISQGDFQVGEIAQKLDPYLEGIADEMAKICIGRKSLVFLPLVETAKKFKAMLNHRGFKAAEVDAKTPAKERAQIIKDYELGKYNVLTCSMLLTEGFDSPAADCVVCLRPTKIRSLYTQIVGRITRLYPEKKEALILDFLWLTERHDLCRPASLYSDSPEVVDEMTRQLEDGEVMDLELLEKDAEKTIMEEKERSLAIHLWAVKNRDRQVVDPLTYIYQIGSHDLLTYTPCFKWESEQATDKQLETLSKFGIAYDDTITKGKARALISELIERQKKGLARPKQIRFLEGKGFTGVADWSIDKCIQMTDEIKNNNWKVPDKYKSMLKLN